ncbi:hypothetical protein KUTeg_002738 [Tegillarca granosa]|uniref:THAP-type domain-containing protein n=1 Tax=Tegillarca granosa TaxID=220873 RepID=A0ABQ9FVD2_TEGGR|nr:hypothetical protein KUTeg_002738 [Tegillarca granosa]
MDRGKTMAFLKPSKDWCCVPGCVSDGRKRGRYPFMNNVLFYPFPSALKEPKIRKKWLDQIMRPNDYIPGRSHRVCSLHFIDGCPTSTNPIPTLSPRNNYGKPKTERSVSARLKREIPMEMEHYDDANTEVTGSRMISSLPVVRHETVVSTQIMLLETCVPECNLHDTCSLTMDEKTDQSSENWEEIGKILSQEFEEESRVTADIGDEDKKCEQESRVSADEKCEDESRVTSDTSDRDKKCEEESRATADT